MRKRRIACVYVRDFGLALWLREDPARRRHPAVLVEKEAAAAPLLAISEVAAAFDIRRAMTVAQARARIPGLRVVVRDPERERTVSRRIVERLQSITPGVEEDAPGTWFVESLGGRLYKGERAFAHRARAIVGSFGVPVCVGVASNRSVARVAAEISAPDSTTVVAPGREKRFLGGLPPGHLETSDEMHEKLAALGLHTTAQVAALPAGELAARFGREGRDTALRARGGDPRSFVPETPPEDCARSEPYVFPLFCSEILTERVLAMLRELFRDLRARGRACLAVRVELHLEDQSREVIGLTLAEPSLSLERFGRQLGRQLDARRLRSGVKGLVVTVTRMASPRSAQLCLPTGRSGRPQIVVPANDSAMPVWTPEICTAILPERSFRLVPSDHAPVREKHAVPALFVLRSPAGMRLCQPPESARIIWQQGRPRRLRWRRADEPITSRRGPWVLSGGWWNGDFDRLYYEVETGAHRHYLIYYDRLAGVWFVQGMFD